MGAKGRLLPTMALVRTFKDLVVWQKAFDLCLRVYRITRLLPREELYGLATELRKTARSVPYNIAEGHRRKSTADYVRFLDIAAGSAAELETQFLLGRALAYFDEKSAQELLGQLAEIERMLAAAMRTLRQRSSPQPNPRPLDPSSP